MKHNTQEAVHVLQPDPLQELCDICGILGIHDSSNLEAVHHNTDWNPHHYHGYTLFRQQV